MPGGGYLSPCALVTFGRQWICSGGALIYIPVVAQRCSGCCLSSLADGTILTTRTSSPPFSLSLRAGMWAVAPKRAIAR